MTNLSDHAIVCGDGRLAGRVAQRLHRLNVPVAVITEADHLDLPDAVMVVQGDPRVPDVLREAGVERAESVVLAGDGDVENLHTSLIVRELAPQARIVARAFSPDLASHFTSLVPNCVALSPGGLAAPAFVAAALEDSQGQRVAIRDRVLVADPSNPERPQLVTDPRKPRQLHRHRPNPLAPLWFAFFWNPRVRAAGFLLLFLILASSAVFTWSEGLSPVDALYYTVTTFTTTGYGDVSVLKSADWVKIFASFLMMAGAALLPIMAALMTDALVSVRLARSLGQVPRSVRGHVILCGIGSVGFSIAVRLIVAGVGVIAVDRDPSSRYASAARELGIPVVAGDARHPLVLESARPQTARALVAATNSDTVNLEVALGARTKFPSLRVVARIFHPDLAKRLHVLIDSGASRSVPDVAAPAFAAAALGARVVGALEVPGGVHIALELDVRPGAPADGRTLDELTADGDGRVLAIDRNGVVEWEPSGTTVLSAGDVVIIDGRSADLRDLVDRVRRAPRP